MRTEHPLIDDENVVLRVDYYDTMPTVAVLHCTVKCAVRVDLAIRYIKRWREAREQIKADGKQVLFAWRPDGAADRWKRFCTLFGFKPSTLGEHVMWQGLGA